MQKKKILITLIVVIILFTSFVIAKKNTNNLNINNTNVVGGTSNTVNTVSEVLGNKDDLVSLSVKAGQEVGGKFKIVGAVKGAYFFEANIIINILDVNKNVLKKGYATATNEWMTVEPVSFEGDIDFTNLPSGPAYIEIHNDNASGLPEHDKSILIPIIIK